METVHYCTLLLDYEAKAGLPRGTIRQAVIGQAYTAWEQLERGEITADEFSRKFSDECSEIVSLIEHINHHVIILCIIEHILYTCWEMLNSVSKHIVWCQGRSNYGRLL